MGYAVQFSFYEKLEDGSYNKEEVKTFHRKVGEPFDDVPKSKIAAEIMKQFARRDIWVLPNVEIFEYSKKAISFKEAKGGILIGNEKFPFDEQEVELKASEVPVWTQHQTGNGQPQQRVIHPHEMIAAGQRQLPQPIQRDQPQQHLPQPINHAPPVVQNGQRRPLRYMTFEPYPHTHEVLKKGYRFTEGKRYPIFNEAPHRLGAVNGMELTTLDDVGREITVPDKYFVPAAVQLIEDPGQRFTDGMSNGVRVPEPKLQWEGVVGDDQELVAKADAEIARMEALRKRKIAR